MGVGVVCIARESEGAPLPHPTHRHLTPRNTPIPTPNTPGKSPRDLSMFLVEKGTAGFRLGQKIEDKLGMRASMTAELVFDECKVRGPSGLRLFVVCLGRGSSTSARSERRAGGWLRAGGLEGGGRGCTLCVWVFREKPRLTLTDPPTLLTPPSPHNPTPKNQVPAANLVGKEHGAALCMMRNLEIERVGLAAMSVGIARRYVRECVRVWMWVCVGVGGCGYLRVLCIGWGAV